MGNHHRVHAICFDVDGTLIEHAEEKTVWQVLNERFLSTTEINRERFIAFREGRLAYDAWVALDVGDWQRAGIHRTAIEDAIRESLAPVAGARETILELHARGYLLAVVSGTISLTLELLLPGLPFDRVYTNRIDFDEDGGIASWQATPFDVQGKALALDELAEHFDVGLEEIAFVGDHWNDLSAMRKAGFSVAFQPKDEQMREIADLVIERPPLNQLLDFFPGTRKE